MHKPVKILSIATKTTLVDAFFQEGNSHQNILHYRDETFMVRCQYDTLVVGFLYGFKFLRLALRFRIFLCQYRVLSFESVLLGH